MAGHSHWAGIKRQKETTDKKRAVLFSKLLKAISAAAKTETNIDFNPRLRTAVEKAKAEKVPQDAIQRAITKATQAGEAVEEVTFEAYGPDGTPMLILGLTDNVNRAVQEVKNILNKANAKWAERGNVLWAFEEVPGERNVWRPKFPQELEADKKEALLALKNDLEESEEVEKVFLGIQ